MFSSEELNNVLSQPIALLGVGATGRSVLKWLAHRGVPSENIIVLEDQWTAEKLQEVEAFSISQIVNLKDVEADTLAVRLKSVGTVIVSPGIFPEHPVRVWCRQTNCRLINDIQLWAWAIEPEAMQLIGITGSNGKSTVTAWTEYVAKACGHEAVAVGNIGLPVLEVLGEIERNERPAVKLWIMELSSFQLEDTEPLPFTAAALLNISEDHLDYHGSMQAYREAKERIFKRAQHAILPYGYTLSHRDEHTLYEDFGVDEQACWHFKHRQLCYRRQPIIEPSALHLLGDHNVLNALVVLALLQAVGENPLSKRVLEALCEFKGLPHRVELIAHYQGVDFIEDSKGTNVGSTLAALEGLGSRYTHLLLIAGGDGKGQDFSPLMNPISRFCREVYLIGRDAPLLAKGLQEAMVKYQYCDSLEAAVETAFQTATSGEAVVLSPACASWDMFRHYVHRAEVFKQSVQGCIERAQNVSTY